MPSNANPPLFVQDGIYPARLDRSHTGALLTPGGKSGSGLVPMSPRPGVRPQGVDSLGETALRVTGSGAKISVNTGVAFVPGDSAVQGIAGVYVVIVDGPQQPVLPAYVPNVDTTAFVGIEISDPEAGGSTVTPGAWSIVAKTTQPAKNWLPLAKVTIPGTANADVKVTDARTYTAALGGTLLVGGSISEIGATAGNAPYGSMAFSVEENVLYQRDRDGWSTIPSVAKVVGGQSTAGVSGRPGQLLWLPDSKTLYVWDKKPDGSPGYIAISRYSPALRTGRESAWAEGPAIRATSPFDLELQVDGGWHSIGSGSITSYNPDKPKPDEIAMILYIRNYSPKSMVYARLTATIEVKKIKPPPDPAVRAMPELETDPAGVADMAIEIRNVTLPGTPVPIAEELVIDPEGTVDVAVEVVGGATIDVDGQQVIDSGGSGYYMISKLEDVLGSTQWQGAARKIEVDVPFVLDAIGDYQVRPVFRSQKASYLDIKGLKVEVTTQYRMT
jgi:hypothetical protein